MTVDEAKVLLGIDFDNTEHDRMLRLCISMLTDYAEEYCGADFSAVMPAGVKLFVGKACEYYMITRPLSSESVTGEYSVSYHPDIPDSLKTILRPYRKARLL